MVFGGTPPIAVHSTLVIVCPKPLCCYIFSMSETIRFMHIQSFMLFCAIKTFRICILCTSSLNTYSQFKHFEPFHHRCIHATKLRSPVVKLCAVFTMLGAQILNRNALFVLLQNNHDLAIATF